jgi:hypothetical protein
MSDEQEKSKWASEDEIPSGFGPKGDLPMIELPSSGVTIVESAKKLFRLMAPSGWVFTRDGVVMRLARREDETLFLKIVTPQAARSLFEKFGYLVVRRAGANGTKVLATTICSAETAKALLESAEAQELLPEIAGLINCPIIYEREGKLNVAQPGYDPISKLLVTGGAEPIVVEPAEAAQALTSLFDEFDFQSAGDKSRAIASLISPALKMGRFIFGHVPADVAEADQSQSGKTYRQKLIAAVYNEKVSLVPKRNGGVGSVDEAFSEQLLAGRLFIQFDNFRDRLDSPFVEAFMTAESSFPCRVPFKGSINVRPEDFFIFMTSNGVETTRDFANRSNIIRIHKKPPGFSFKKYEEGSLLEHVKAKQAYYLGCVFSVIRAWHAAGKRRTNETRHDFKGWVQVVDWIVQNQFNMTPLMDGHQEAQERVSNPDVVFLRSVVLALVRTEQLGEPQSASDIAGICEAHSINIPGIRYSADLDKMARLVGACFARKFREEDSIRMDDFQISRQFVKKKLDSGNGYVDSKVYVVERVGCPPAAEAISNGKCTTRRVETTTVSFMLPPTVPKDADAKTETTA